MAYGKISSNRQWGKALLAFLFALLAFGLGVAWDIFASNPPEGVTPSPLPSYVLYFISISQLFTVVRCLKSRSAHTLAIEDLDGDARAPILYLRPFTQDNAVLSSGARIFNPLNPFSWGKLRRWRGFFTSYAAFFSFKWTFEQLLEAKTRTMGPLVAIGQPGAPPIMGAHNLYVGEEWQDRVIDLSQRAQLVVLAAGDTPGIMWEVNYMLENLDPEKCMIFVEGGRYRSWWPLWRKGSRRSLWKKFLILSKDAFPVPLPNKLSRAAFVGFDASWEPKLIDPPRRPPAADPRNTIAYELTQIL